MEWQEACQVRCVQMEWRRGNSECDMPYRMLADENFRMRDARIECWQRRIFECGDVRVEWWREEFRCDVSGWSSGGGILDAICPGGMNVVMSSMKDRYGLYGYGAWVSGFNRYVKE